MHTISQIQAIVDRYHLGKVDNFTEHLGQVLLKIGKEKYKIICKDPELIFPYTDYDKFVSGDSEILLTISPHPSKVLHLFHKKYSLYKVGNDASFSFNDDLLKKAAQAILKSNLFLLNTEKGNRTDQQSLFLTIAGYKPVSLIGSGDKVKTDTGWRLVPTDKKLIAKIFDTFDLHHTMQSGEYTTDCLVSRNPKLLDLIVERDHATVGLLYGYPKSAVDALIEGSLMDKNEQERLLDNEGLFYAPFRLSMANFAKEIELLHTWNNLLLRYNLV